MKVNLAFTQPQIPPPSPMLTGKARTARARNVHAGLDASPKRDVLGLEIANGENVPFS